MQKTTTKTEIQQAAICRCTDKKTKEVFYTMKSDSSDTWYQVRWNGNTWMCNCPATKPCKHMRAVNEVLAVRRSRIAAQMGGDTPAIVAKMQAQEDWKYQHENVTVEVGNGVTVTAARNAIDNAVSHHNWMKEMRDYARAKDAADEAERTARETAASNVKMFYHGF